MQSALPIAHASEPCELRQAGMNRRAIKLLAKLLIQGSPEVTPIDDG